MRISHRLRANALGNLCGLSNVESRKNADFEFDPERDVSSLVLLLLHATERSSSDRDPGPDRLSYGPVQTADLALPYRGPM